MNSILFLILFVLMSIFYMISLPLITSGSILYPKSNALCPESDECKKSKKVNPIMIGFGVTLLLAAIIIAGILVYTHSKTIKSADLQSLLPKRSI